MNFSPIKIIEEIQSVIQRHELDTTSILQGCYALRFPLFHFIGVFHPDDRRPLEKRIGDFTFLASDLVGGLLWFEKIRLLRVIKAAMVMPLTRFTVALRGISYLFYGAHAIKQLNGQEKVQAILDLSAAVAQVALSVLIVIGVTHAIVIPALTVVAYGLTAASIAYPIALVIKNIYVKCQEKRRAAA